MTSPVPGSALPRDLPSLTSLRLVAALVVFVFHIGARWHVVDLPVSEYGYVGVAFFFILSGFILTWGHRPGVPVRSFYVRRVARVYPAHIVVALLALAVPVTAQAGVWPQLPANLLLVQAWVPEPEWAFSINGVAWSLSCEIFFYLCFPLILWWARPRSTRTVVTAAVVLFAVTSAVAVSAVVLHLTDLRFITYTSPVFRLSEFVLGIAVCVAVRDGWRPRLPLLAAAAVLAAVGTAAVGGRPAPDVWVTPFFALVIAWFACRDVRGPSWVGARPLVYAGQVSFAFYLVHEVVLLNLLDPLGPGWGVAALILVVSAVLAAAVHHLVELPAQTLIVRRFGAAKPVPPSSPIAS